jgi:outer membrane lipoprotein-sorting protein
VEYTVEGTATKMWIWEEYAFPIRVEVTTTEGKTTIEYKNIEFVDIPDSMFELPAGVEIIQMPGQ